MKKILKTFEHEIYEPISLKDLEAAVQIFKEDYPEIRDELIYIDKKVVNDYYDGEYTRIVLRYDLYETDEQYADRLKNEKEALKASKRFAKKAKEEHERKEYERLKQKFEKA